METRFDWWKWLVITCFAMLALSMFCRCMTTKYVPVTEYRDRIVNKTDSFFKVDSVWLHDSISIYMRGDTVFKDRWKYKDRFRYIYKNSTDTLVVRDSIPYKVEVEKQLSKTDKAFLRLGKSTAAILFVGILGLIGWGVKRFVLRK